MALIICPECGKEISDQAPKCIHCGYPVNPQGLVLELENAKKPNNKSKLTKKATVCIVAGAAAIILFVAVYFTTFTPAAIYKRAEKAFAAENYAKAMDLYERTEGYELSAIKLEESTILYHYTEGVKAVSNEAWEIGKSHLLECADYEDSTMLIQKCDYGIACLRMTEGSYQEAKDIFLGFENYEDSQEKIYECNYYLAEALNAQNELLEAAKMYGQSHSFSDADEKIALIGDYFLDEKSYSDAYDAYCCINVVREEDKKSKSYAEGQVKLDSKNYEAASKAFESAKPLFDAEELYCSSTYSYAEELLNKNKYTDAQKWFNTIPTYKDAQERSSECMFLYAQENISTGYLNNAKTTLESMDPNFSVNGVSVSDLLGRLEKNSKWVDICGKWTSSKGKMETRQTGSYGYWNGWSREIKQGEQSIEVRCILNDDGSVNVVTSGSVPIFTNYSSISIALNSSTKNLSANQKMTSMGKITVDQDTTINLSATKITVNYKKTDNTQDVYFNYAYSTEVTYDKIVKKL